MWIAAFPLPYFPPNLVLNARTNSNVISTTFSNRLKPDGYHFNKKCVKANFKPTVCARCSSSASQGASSSSAGGEDLPQQYQESQIVILMWTGNNVTGPFRVAGAAALAPVIDRGLRRIQKYFNFPSLVYAFALLVSIVVTPCLTIVGLLILSRWENELVMPPVSKKRGYKVHEAPATTCLGKNCMHVALPGKWRGCFSVSNLWPSGHIVATLYNMGHMASWICWKNERFVRIFR